MSSPAPFRQTNYRLHKRFEEPGSVHDLPKSGRSRIAAIEDNVTIVANLPEEICP